MLPQLLAMVTFLPPVGPLFSYVNLLLPIFAQASHNTTTCIQFDIMIVVMPPTLKKLEGHIAFGSSVGGCVRHVFICLL